MLPTFTYMLPTCFLLATRKFATCYPQVCYMLCAILAVTKLRLAVDKVTPRRRQSYASPPTKCHIDDHKVGHRRHGSYALTLLKHNFDHVKTMFCVFS